MSVNVNRKAGAGSKEQNPAYVKLISKCAARHCGCRGEAVGAGTIGAHALAVLLAIDAEADVVDLVAGATRGVSRAFTTSSQGGSHPCRACRHERLLSERNFIRQIDRCPKDVNLVKSQSQDHQGLT